MNKISIYTDGACSNNGSDEAIGGWAAIVTNGTRTKVLSGGARDTTNNRMEIISILEALKYVKEHLLTKDPLLGIRIFSDSAYAINGINERWIKKWINNGWKNAKGAPVQNKDLWEIMNKLDKEINFQLIKVKGHNGNELNELADWHATNEVTKLKNIAK